MMAAELKIKCSLDVAKHVHHVLLATGSREQCGHHGLVVAPARHHQPLPLSAPDCGAEDDWKKLLRSNGQTHCALVPLHLQPTRAPKGATAARPRRIRHKFNHRGRLRTGGHKADSIPFLKKGTPPRQVSLECPIQPNEAAAAPVGPAPRRAGEEVEHAA